MSKSLMEELKEMCLKIVGDWYHADTGQHITFSLNDKLLKESKIILRNGDNVHEDIYGVAVKIKIELEDKTHFYFDVGRYEKRYYEIIELTKDELILNEFFMIPDKPPSPTNIKYIRKTDISFAEDILKGLD